MGARSTDVPGDYDEDRITEARREHQIPQMVSKKNNFGDLYSAYPALPGGSRR
jgi:hypothetical protein